MTMNAELIDQTSAEIIKQGTTAICEAMPDMFAGLKTSKNGTASIRLKIKVQMDGGRCLVETDADGGGMDKREKIKLTPKVIDPSQPELIK